MLSYGTFYVESDAATVGTTFNFVPGMTWAEWLSSSHNRLGSNSVSEFIMDEQDEIKEGTLYYNDLSEVQDTDIITDGYTYVFR